MEIFLIKAAQLLLCFMLLVLLHEGGHFFFAKVFGIRVKKFCIFFDPSINLGFKKFSGTLKLFTLHGTDYHLGWLPLGGYVNIAGMVDESTTAEQLEEDDTPAEQRFCNKPAWQRLLVMVGGVLMNFITALVIYSAIFFTWGEEYVPARNMLHGYVFNEQAQAMGFRNGDIVISTDKTVFERWNGDVYTELTKANSVNVLRNGKEVTINLPEKLDLVEMVKQTPLFMEPAVPSIVDSVMPKGPADNAGMRKGDRIVAFNGKGVETWNELDVVMGIVSDQIAAADGKVGDNVLNASIVVRHDGSESLDTLKCRLSDERKMGVIKHNVLAEYQTETISYNALSCIPAGIRHGWEQMCNYIYQLKFIFSSEGAKSVGSFGTIGSLFPSAWYWPAFWSLTAFISIILAVMNFLPIPMLDGGYIFLTLIEVITRRKFSERAIERVNTIGFYLVLALMALGIFNDFARMVFHIY